MQKNENRVTAILVVLTLCIGASAAYAADPPVKTFQIGPQSVSTALKAFAAQADMQLIFTESDAGEAQSGGVTGKKSAREALQAILKGTGLAFEFTANNVVVVRKAVAAGLASAAAKDPPGEGAKDPRKEGKSGSSDGFRVAQVDQEKVSAGSQVGEHGDEGRDEKKRVIEEILVTGTHIRGVTDTASPRQVYTADDIDRSGLGSVQEFVQRLPQDFKGGASEGTVGSVAGGGRADNRVGGSGINLRGLGNDSTLVLVDGRRVAPGNSDANFVDISLIPMSAVARIEMVSDGASAIYGSDAVGGVVNFVLRRDFEGVETRARYGSVSEGASHEIQAGETFGKRWDSGSALLSYEFYDRTPLYASDRSYSSAAVEPFTLLPEQVRQGAFLTASQTLTQDVSLFADGTYSRRSTHSVSTLPLFTISGGPISAETYGGTIGIHARLSERVELEVASSYSASRTHVENQFDGFPSGSQDTDSSILSLDAKADGPLWDIPSGTVRFAVGGQYRHEGLDSENLLAKASFNPHRNLAAGFFELQVPLLDSNGGISSSANHLELSLAGRYEHYSDFGSTFNPKVGLIWRPLESLKLRSTYGTSFKAPLLNDENPVPSQVVAQQEFDPRTGGNTNVLQVFGGNPNLRAEKATTWTAGIDIVPTSIPELKAYATYYNIKFRNRITDAQSEGFDVTDALRIEGALGPTIIQRNPSSSLVQALASTPGYSDLTGIPGGVNLATIGAIIDSRALNLSRLRTSGIDGGLSYTATLAPGNVETAVDSTYILRFDKQFTSTTPALEILNTPYNPVKTKLRAREVFHRANFTIAAYVNYTASYHDNRNPAMVVPVGSWTTGDLSIDYDFGANAGILSRLSAQLSVINITNADPPFVASPNPLFFPGVNFDGANASVLGRFFAFQLNKRW